MLLLVRRGEGEVGVSCGRIVVYFAADFVVEVNAVALNVAVYWKQQLFM